MKNTTPRQPKPGRNMSSLRAWVYRTRLRTAWHLSTHRLKGNLTTTKTESLKEREGLCLVLVIICKMLLQVLAENSPTSDPKRVDVSKATLGQTSALVPMLDSHTCCSQLLVELVKTQSACSSSVTRHTNSSFLHTVFLLVGSHRDSFWPLELLSEVQWAFSLTH